ncbi:MAG: Tfp pilus assembly protein PilX [Psychromonas sp.]|jgi:Tfp pilus assembly protein PilX|uniref:pilus assembly PilX family protein n=1 Tax=Psychromonas sp. TaxID=1884585 RepID=UPI0039E3E026
MKQQKGFVLVSVLIITTITTMLAFSQFSENRLQERIAGNQEKEINARLAAEKGVFDAFVYIEAQNVLGTSNENIETNLNKTPYTNTGNVSTLQDIILVDIHLLLPVKAKLTVLLLI